MAKINLNLKKELFIPSFYPLLLDYSHRWEFYCGSAGSGKSYSLAQKIIIRCCKEPIKVLVCRRYATTLRNSCFSLFKEILDKWKLTKYVKIKETDMSFHFPNGSSIILLGLDIEEKLLSLNNVSTVWVEEAYEVEYEKILQLNLRMRGQAANQQIFLSWNPISKQSYLYNFTVENPPENSIFHHSTYRNNPFLNAEYVAALDEMAIRNPAKYRVYGLGEWGVDSSGLVLTNWKTEDFDPLELAALGYEHRVGLDLGWVDKTAIIDSLYDRKNKTIYVFNEFYKSGCQPSQIAEAIEDMKIGKTKIFVDAAEPRTIQFFRNEGINATPCAKGKDSVKAGLMFLQDCLIVVHPRCKNFIMELENFSYIKSKVTGEYTEDTTHEFSHAIDACRYAYSDIYTNKKMKTLDKSILGI
jgi:phage terminase large subunit